MYDIPSSRLEVLSPRQRADVGAARGDAATRACEEAPALQPQAGEVRVHRPARGRAHSGADPPVLCALLRDDDLERRR